MSHLCWNNDYATGNYEIDLQHKFFLELINRLEDELDLSDDTDYQIQLLWELQKYAEFHFLSEENRIRKAGLPGLDEQRKLHHELNYELCQMIQFALAGVTIDDGHKTLEAERSPKEIIAFLRSWFIEHTIDKDKNIFSGTGPIDSQESG